MAQEGFDRKPISRYDVGELATYQVVNVIGCEHRLIRFVEWKTDWLDLVVNLVLNRKIGLLVTFRMRLPPRASFSSAAARMTGCRSR